VLLGVKSRSLQSSAIEYHNPFIAKSGYVTWSLLVSLTNVMEPLLVARLASWVHLWYGVRGFIAISDGDTIVSVAFEL